MLITAVSTAVSIGVPAFIVVMLLAVGYGYFTREGSGIASHPTHGDDAPGSIGRTESSGQDEGQGSTLETHGTQ